MSLMLNLLSMKTNDQALLEAALIGYQHQLDQLEGKMADLRRQLGGKPPAAAPKSASGPGKRRHMSAAARKRIATAQRKRWAEYHRLKGSKS